MCHPRTTSCLVAKCPVGAQWQRQDASPLQPSHVVQRQSLRHHVDGKCESRMTLLLQRPKRSIGLIGNGQLPG